MVSHDWSDDDFDFNGLYEAEYWITKQVKRFSGCYLMSKEKYGTIRYEYIFPPGGRLWFQNRFYRWWNECWLYHKWTNFGWLVTKYVVFRAIKKWPHLKDELLQDLATHEELVGKEIHNQYWITITSNNLIDSLNSEDDDEK